MSDVYVGPIQHDASMCQPDRCPGDHGCWCAACEAGVHGDAEREAWYAEQSAGAPITHEERGIVLDLLPRALNASGIALALGYPQAAIRAQVVLDALLAEGRVRRESGDVWRVA